MRGASSLRSGTWLLKQKEAVPHGQWLPWLEKHCDFTRMTARNYMAVAGLDVKRALHLSIRDCLWEVVQAKAEEAGRSETDHGD